MSQPEYPTIDGDTKTERSAADVVVVVVKVRRDELPMYLSARPRYLQRVHPERSEATETVGSVTAPGPRRRSVFRLCPAAGDATNSAFEEMDFWCGGRPDAPPQSFDLYMADLLEKYKLTVNVDRERLIDSLHNKGAEQVEDVADAIVDSLQLMTEIGDRDPMADGDNLRSVADAIQIAESTKPTVPLSDSDDGFVSDLAAAVFEAFRNAGGRFEDRQSAVVLGQQIGKQAAAATAWRSRVGRSLETEQVTRLLGISRQALASRKRTGSVLALAGIGTSYYPEWQFEIDGNEATVRPITLGIVAAFRERDENISPHKIAAWAMSPQPELDGQTPAGWINAGGSIDPVLVAARRTAALEVL